MIKSDNNLHLVILGSNGLADEFSTKLKVTILYTMTKHCSFNVNLNKNSINDKFTFFRHNVIIKNMN